MNSQQQNTTLDAFSALLQDFQKGFHQVQREIIMEDVVDLIDIKVNGGDGVEYDAALKRKGINKDFVSSINAIVKAGSRDPLIVKFVKDKRLQIDVQDKYLPDEQRQAIYEHAKECQDIINTADNIDAIKKIIDYSQKGILYPVANIDFIRKVNALETFLSNQNDNELLSEHINILDEIIIKHNEVYDERMFHYDENNKLLYGFYRPGLDINLEERPFPRPREVLPANKKNIPTEDRPTEPGDDFDQWWIARIRSLGERKVPIADVYRIIFNEIANSDPNIKDPRNITLNLMAEVFGRDAINAFIDSTTKATPTTIPNFYNRVIAEMNTKNINSINSLCREVIKDESVDKVRYSEINNSFLLDSKADPFKGYNGGKRVADILLFGLFTKFGDDPKKLNQIVGELEGKANFGESLYTQYKASNIYEDNFSEYADATARMNRAFYDVALGLDSLAKAKGGSGNTASFVATNIESNKLGMLALAKHYSGAHPLPLSDVQLIQEKIEENEKQIRDAVAKEKHKISDVISDTFWKRILFYGTIGLVLAFIGIALAIASFAVNMTKVAQQSSHNNDAAAKKDAEDRKHNHELVKEAQAGYDKDKGTIDGKFNSAITDADNKYNNFIHGTPNIQDTNGRTLYDANGVCIADMTNEQINSTTQWFGQNHEPININGPIPPVYQEEVSGIRNVIQGYTDATNLHNNTITDLNNQHLVDLQNLENKYNNTLYNEFQKFDGPDVNNGGLQYVDPSQKDFFDNATGKFDDPKYINIDPNAVNQSSGSSVDWRLLGPGIGLFAAGATTGLVGAAAAANSKSKAKKHSYDTFNNLAKEHALDDKNYIVGAGGNVYSSDQQIESNTISQVHGGMYDSRINLNNNLINRSTALYSRIKDDNAVNSYYQGPGNTIINNRGISQPYTSVSMANAIPSMGPEINRYNFRTYRQLKENGSVGAGLTQSTSNISEVLEGDLNNRKKQLAQLEQQRKKVLIDAQADAKRASSIAKSYRNYAEETKGFVKKYNKEGALTTDNNSRNIK